MVKIVNSGPSKKKKLKDEKKSKQTPKTDRNIQDHLIRSYNWRKT